MSNSEKQKDEGAVSRRGMFHIIGTAPVLAAAAAGSVMAQEDHAHMAHSQPPAADKGPYKRRTFNDQEWRTVGVLSDLIIPADERSGSATQAGVSEFLDDWIAFRKEEDESFMLEAQIRGGLMWIDAESRRLFDKNFADSSADQQKQVLDRIAWPERAKPEDLRWVLFFNRFRDLVLTGFYSSKMGVADLPYKGNVAVMKWEGCPPEVWAIIEERMKNGYKGVTLQDVKPWSA
jgi:gluconate 2-dehydrogenase gamma chain